MIQASQIREHTLVVGSDGSTWFGRTVGWLLAYQARPNGRLRWPGAFHPARLGRFGGGADDPARQVQR